MYLYLACTTIPYLSGNLFRWNLFSHQLVYCYYYSTCSRHNQAALSNIRASLNRQEAQKKLKYKEACDRRGATFLPFVISAGEGILSPQASVFLNQLANGLATKWNKTKAGVRSWIHTRLTFAVIRGSSMCILDRQYSWKKIGLYQYDFYPLRNASLDGSQYIPLQHNTYR